MAAFDQNKASSELNQYWYSDATIETLVSEIKMCARNAAFLSTPSLYFALPDDLRSRCKVFEYDRQWSSDPGFVFFDFNKPEEIPVNLWEAFDYVVVDPPFITREVWSKYGETVRLIAKKDARFLFTSVLENHQMLEEVCDTVLYVPLFQPSIPKLTYQYHCFTNYEASQLQVANPELPAEDPSVTKARQMANDMRQSQTAFKEQVQSRNREGEVPLPAAQRQQQQQADGGAAAAQAAADPAMKWTHVPEGWTEFPEGGPAAEAAPVSEEYRALEDRRAKMTSLRTLVDDVIKAAEGAVKPYIVLKLATTDEAKKAEAQAKIESQQAQKEEALAKLDAVVDELAAKDASDARGVCALMKKFAADWRTPVEEKDAYMEKCADATRLYKSPIFNRQKELLAEMKAVKKRDQQLLQQKA